ncbi:MAG TPA: hypothetical protein VF008_31210 [Niastella sp.]
MKKIVYTIALLVSMLSAKAEYEWWLLKFTIEQTDGKKVTGYAYAFPTAFNKDSINNTRYLINAMDHLDHKNDSAILLCKNRIRYDYKQQGGTDLEYIYTLATIVTIKTKNIRKITILEMLDSDYLSVIRNDITLQDTAWMRTKVVKTVVTGGYLCGYELYFHEYNSELEKLLKELKEKAKKAEANEEDMIMEPVLKKIMRFKVIVIASCSC